MCSLVFVLAAAGKWFQTSTDILPGQLGAVRDVDASTNTTISVDPTIGLGNRFVLRANVSFPHVNPEIHPMGAY